MGLDTSHNAWHGSYSSFGRFRDELAKRIGINLDEYAGYNSGWKEGDPLGKDLKSIDHPLRDLFDHSDCDGELTPAQCFTIAEGLKMVMDEIKIDEMKDFLVQDFFENCNQFRDGCLLAYSKNESIDFH